MSFFSLFFVFSFFFFNDPATTEIYTLSLHDALPIFHLGAAKGGVDIAERAVFPHLFRRAQQPGHRRAIQRGCEAEDRKSTRLNSSHLGISYAVFCLKKKTKKTKKFTTLTSNNIEAIK